VGFGEAPLIITRSPLRISLGGGGTDLPSYYREHAGFVLSAAIDKYVYITLHDTFEQQFIIKYSKTELVQSVEEIRHPIIREALKLVPVSAPHLEVVSMSDIPAGTGLGSSGSFTVGLLRALYAHNKTSVTRQQLAENACHIEIDLLGEPIGKQDQYISSFGGITSFLFDPDGRVTVQPVPISSETLYNLEDNLLLFFTGFTRSASAILAEQDNRTREGDSQMIDHLHQVKKFGYQIRTALESGDLRRFAAIMRDHWELKKQRAQAMTNSRIDEYYDLACANGALGGKLIGAGGGGFLMFYTEEKTRLRRVMREAGLREVRVRFDLEGATLVARS
jgi:D-glycero-alpha-D-manno-heptose-7-phosphate kinase